MNCSNCLQHSFIKHWYLFYGFGHLLQVKYVVLGFLYLLFLFANKAIWKYIFPFWELMKKRDPIYDHLGNTGCWVSHFVTWRWLQEFTNMPIRSHKCFLCTTGHYLYGDPCGLFKLSLFPNGLYFVGQQFWCSVWHTINHIWSQQGQGPSFYSLCVHSALYCGALHTE